MRTPRLPCTRTLPAFVCGQEVQSPTTAEEPTQRGQTPRSRCGSLSAGPGDVFTHQLAIDLTTALSGNSDQDPQVGLIATNCALPAPGAPQFLQVDAYCLICSHAVTIAIDTNTSNRLPQRREASRRERRSTAVFGRWSRSNSALSNMQRRQ